MYLLQWKNPFLIYVFLLFYAIKSILEGIRWYVWGGFYKSVKTKNYHSYFKHMKLAHNFSSKPK